MSRQIDVTKWPLSKEDREYMLTRGREAELERLQAQYEADKAAADVVVEEVAEPYEKWKIGELRDEANARKLTIDPKAKDEKAALVAALEKHDEENPV